MTEYSTQGSFKYIRGPVYVGASPVTPLDGSGEIHASGRYLYAHSVLFDALQDGWPNTIAAFDGAGRLYGATAASIVGSTAPAAGFLMQWDASAHINNSIAFDTSQNSLFLQNVYGPYPQDNGDNYESKLATVGYVNYVAGGIVSSTSFSYGGAYADTGMSIYDYNPGYTGMGQNCILFVNCRANVPPSQDCVGSYVKQIFFRWDNYGGASSMVSILNAWEDASGTLLANTGADVVGDPAAPVLHILGFYSGPGVAELVWRTKIVVTEDAVAPVIGP